MTVWFISDLPWPRGAARYHIPPGAGTVVVQQACAERHGRHNLSPGWAVEQQAGLEGAAWRAQWSHRPEPSSGPTCMCCLLGPSVHVALVQAESNKQEAPRVTAVLSVAPGP